MTRHCLCAPTGNARSHNSIFLNAFEAQNLFQNDLDNGGVWVVILVECSGGETPGAHVADAVALVVKSGECQPEAKDDRKQKWGRTRLLNLLLKQLSGIPLRDTVVNGTRQSDFERFFGNSCFSSFVLPSASVEELSL